MSNSTVRISANGQLLLRQLAEEEKLSLQAMLDKVLDAYRRKRFLEQVNEAYAAEQRPVYPPGTPPLAEELASLDGTLLDGLDPSESWTDEDRAPRPKGRTRPRKGGGK